MSRPLFFLALMCVALLEACKQGETRNNDPLPELTTVKPASDSMAPERKSNDLPTPAVLAPSNTINTGDHTPEEILAFAKTLIGTPYLFASTDPAKGFDCSGFITYVFNHFDIRVPRSSIDFTNQGKEVELEDSYPGDLILFTGTDSSTGRVGHMGIVESWRGDTLYFIHSSSGKANGVVITPFHKHYQSRFIKVIRVFPEAYFPYRE